MYSPPEIVCYENYVNVIDDVKHKARYHVINCWQTSVHILVSVHIREEAWSKNILLSLIDLCLYHVFTKDQSRLGWNLNKMASVLNLVYLKGIKTCFFPPLTLLVAGLGISKAPNMFLCTHYHYQTTLWKTRTISIFNIISM